MCVTNTSSSMAVVSSKPGQKPLNPHAKPFIRSAATSFAAPPQQHGPYTPLFPLTPVTVYPHLLCASAPIQHPKTTINKGAKQHSTAVKLVHPKKTRQRHNRFLKIRGARKCLPPRLRTPAPAPRKRMPAPAPAPLPVNKAWMKKLVNEATEPNCKNTSVMMRNIPNQYRRDDLMEFIDKFCLEKNMQYDFLYLPMDFKRHNNKGYAFINFIKPDDARVFQGLLNGYKWGWVHLRNSNFKSKKTCEITWAKIQGKKGLVRHFSNTNFPCFTEKYLPVELSPPSNGSSSPSAMTIVGRCLSYK